MEERHRRTAAGCGRGDLSWMMGGLVEISVKVRYLTGLDKVGVLRDGSEWEMGENGGIFVRNRLVVNWVGVSK